MGIGEIAPRAAVSFAWRTILATGASSVWWVAPLLVQSKYGLNFLQFTEQVGAIWGTTSLTESLRLMSYWPSYLGVGYTDRLLPYFNDSPTMLFDPAVVVSSLLVPALALGGYVVTRSRRYVPLLLACGLVALLVMSVGYPTGTLLRSGVTFIYNRVAAVQFLRTTYKAGPVLALAVALLLGAAAGAAWTRIGSSKRHAAGDRAERAAGAGRRAGGAQLAAAVRGPRPGADVQVGAQRLAPGGPRPGREPAGQQPRAGAARARRTASMTGAAPSIRCCRH